MKNEKIIDELMTNKQSNRQKKKSNANVHNTTNEIAQSMLPIGQCNQNPEECDGNLFMFLQSKEENIFNIYCTECEKIKDFKKIDDEKNVKLYFTPKQIMETLIQNYGEDIIDKLMN